MSSGSSICSAAAFRASPRAAQGSGKAPTMSDGFGENGSGLFAPLDRLGSSLKTSVGSSLCRLRAGLSVTWRERGTKSGLFYSEPTTSGPRTSGTGSGSSESWSTPLASDSLGEMHQSKKAVEMGFAPRLQDQARAWPTPRAEDHAQTGAHRGVPDTLTSAARVSSVDTDSTSNPSANTDAQTAKAREWQTPKARDVKGQSQRGIHAPGDALMNMVASVGPPAPASPSTDGKRRDWCTPTVVDQTNRQYQYSSGDRSKPVLTMPGQVRLGSSGQLNPAWVTQLMGFPDGWLDLPEETLSRLSATRSSQASRRS